MTSQSSETSASASPGLASSPAGPAGAAEEKDPSRFTLPLRQPAAFALLVVNGVMLLFAVVDLLAIFQDWSANFLNSVDTSFGTFVGLVSVGFPLLAVLLATHIKPPLAQARLITVGALIEYAVSAVFGVVCLLAGFLHGLTSTNTFNGLSSPRRALESFLIRGAWLVLLAVAALAVFQLFQGLYARAKPAPTGYPQQPGYPPNYGQYPPQQAYAPAPPPYGQPQPGWAGPASTQPTYAPGQQPYGEPTVAFQPPYPPPGYQAPPPAAASSPFASYANPQAPAGPTSAPPGPTSAPPGPTSAPPGPTSAPPAGARPGEPAAQAHPASQPSQPPQPDDSEDDAQRTQVIQPPAGPDDPTQRWGQP